MQSHEFYDLKPLLTFPFLSFFISVLFECHDCHGQYLYYYLIQCMSFNIIILPFLYFTCFCLVVRNVKSYCMLLKGFIIYKHCHI